MLSETMISSITIPALTKLSNKFQDIRKWRENQYAKAIQYVIVIKTRLAIYSKQHQ